MYSDLLFTCLPAGREVVYVCIRAHAESRFVVGKDGMVKVRSKTKKKRFSHMETGISFALILSALLLTLTVIGMGMRYGYQWLKTTPFLSISEIAIECDDQAVRQRALESLDGFRGQNIIGVDLMNVKAKLMKDPWVASVDLSKVYPHILHVAVEARHAVAFLRAGGTLYFMDSQGRLFMPGDGAKTIDLVELKGVRPHGGRELISRITSFLGLVEACGKLLCRENIDSIHIEDGCMIVMTKGNGIPLKFSLESPLKVQFMRAEAILYHLYSSGKYRHVVAVELWVGKDKAVAALKKKV